MLSGHATQRLHFCRLRHLKSPLTSRLSEAGYTIDNRSERLRRRFEFSDRQLSALTQEASVLGHFLGVPLAE